MLIDMNMEPSPKSNARITPAVRMGLGYTAAIGVISSVLGLLSILFAEVSGSISKQTGMLGSIVFSALGIALSLIWLIAAIRVGRAYSCDSLSKMAGWLLKPPILGFFIFLYLGLGSALGGTGVHPSYSFLSWLSIGHILLMSIGGGWVTSLGYKDRGKDSPETPKE